MSAGARPVPPIERFFRHVEVTESCWNWTGGMKSNPYPQFRATSARSAVPAHRWLFQELGHALPHSMDLYRLCRNKVCVRPEHMEVTTRKETQRRQKHLNRRPTITHKIAALRAVVPANAEPGAMIPRAVGVSDLAAFFLGSGSSSRSSIPENDHGAPRNIAAQQLVLCLLWWFEETAQRCAHNFESEGPPEAITELMAVAFQASQMADILARFWAPDQPLETELVIPGPVENNWRTDAECAP